MSKDKTQPIVVKKKKGGHGGHHGGAWKIAYADFVTAMMAFFLLMWLLGSTSKGDLMGISEYFQTPLQVALFGGSGAGDAASVIKGGGTDLSKSSGQVKKGEVKQQKDSINSRAVKLELDLPERVDVPLTPQNLSPEKNQEMQQEQMDIENLSELKANMEEMIDATDFLKEFKNQILLEIIDEGLRIQIVDAQNRPMFDLSSDNLKPYAQQLLGQIGKALNAVPYKITISGHTDNLPYKGGATGFSNWELSVARANSARREMAKAGMKEDKIIRILGHASTIPFNKQKPEDPANRRISIVVLKNSAVTKALQERPVESLEYPR